MLWFLVAYLFYFSFSSYESTLGNMVSVRFGFHYGLIRFLSLLTLSLITDWRWSRHRSNRTHDLMDLLFKGCLHDLLSARVRHGLVHNNNKFHVIQNGQKPVHPITWECKTFGALWIGGKHTSEASRRTEGGWARKEAVQSYEGCIKSCYDATLPWEIEICWIQNRTLINRFNLFITTKIIIIIFARKKIIFKKKKQKMKGSLVPCHREPFQVQSGSFWAG